MKPYSSSSSSPNAIINPKNACYGIFYGSLDVEPLPCVLAWYESLVFYHIPRQYVEPLLKPREKLSNVLLLQSTLYINILLNLLLFFFSIPSTQHPGCLAKDIRRSWQKKGVLNRKTQRAKRLVPIDNNDAPRCLKERGVITDLPLCLTTWRKHGLYVWRLKPWQTSLPFMDVLLVTL